VAGSFRAAHRGHNLLEATGAVVGAYKFDELPRLSVISNPVISLHAAFEQVHLPLRRPFEDDVSRS
jgi:hypothetical protein